MFVPSVNELCSLSTPIPHLINSLLIGLELKRLAFYERPFTCISAGLNIRVIRIPTSGKMNMRFQQCCLLLIQLTLSFGYIDTSIDVLPSAYIIGPSNTPPLSLSDILSTLSTLQRKPTCYRTAATSLMHHCKALSTDIPDPDRIHFAIKLTICELEIIQQIPSVCRIETRWKDCVKVLATKDNWWTSFSGNLRDVSNVCWIGRQEVEKGDTSCFCADERSIIGIAYEFDFCTSKVIGNSP